jgi:hypothetical protein
MNDQPKCQWCNGTGIEPEKRLYLSRLAYVVLRISKPCAACSPRPLQNNAAEIDRLLAEEAKK